MASGKVPMDSLKAFVRREGPRFLKQENVTSIGIGRKIKDGVATAEICVQFTVGKKVAPEGLEAIGAEELPKSFRIDGVDVPSDVIERSYGKSAREVAMERKLQDAAARKAVADPVVPGVSVGNKTISAGTAGCVVYDAQDGTPYILSNWHVLQGAEGAIGDMIVQPGPHDDNRVDRNEIGRLARSHLGAAGDCAISTVDRRGLSPRILGLGVGVGRIGEAELGDGVVKSGRTTEVTYGLVTRVHTTVKIDYGEAGRPMLREIGCFEIGPDPEHPAPDGEISMGGDSGSAWLLSEKGKATDMMLGLHFAGEVGNESEHALACYAASVCEKLAVSPAPPSAAIASAEGSIGYRAAFLGTEVPPPLASEATVRKDLLEVGGATIVDYTHFSLAMSASRRFARWVAWNVDGGSLRKLSRTGVAFKKDSRFPEGQIGDELYSGNRLDRGHLARRADLVWGKEEEAKRANGDSFYFSNITPQHEGFNQSAAGGLWGQLENAIFEDVDVADLRISVMCGPILADGDPEYRGVRIPKSFWKVVYFRESGADGVQAKGFVLTQADLLNRVELLELPEFAVYGVPVEQIGSMAGLALFPGKPTASRSGDAPPRAEGMGRPGAAGGAPAIRLIRSASEIAR